MGACVSKNGGEGEREREREREREIDRVWLEWAENEKKMMKN